MSGQRVRYTIDFHLHIDSERNTVDVLKDLKPSKRQECMRQWMALGRAVEKLMSNEEKIFNEAELQNIVNFNPLRSD